MKRLAGCRGTPGPRGRHERRGFATSGNFCARIAPTLRRDWYLRAGAISAASTPSTPSSAGQPSLTPKGANNTVKRSCSARLCMTYGKKQMPGPPADITCVRDLRLFTPEARWSPCRNPYFQAAIRRGAGGARPRSRRVGPAGASAGRRHVGSWPDGSRGAAPDGKTLTWPMRFAGTMKGRPLPTLREKAIRLLPEQRHLALAPGAATRSSAPQSSCGRRFRSAPVLAAFPEAPGKPHGPAGLSCAIRR